MKSPAPKWYARFSVLASLCAIGLLLVTMVWLHPCEHLDQSHQAVERAGFILWFIRMGLALAALVLASVALGLFIKRGPRPHVWLGVLALVLGLIALFSSFILVK